MTVKAGSAETGKSFAQLEMNDPRGTATPMHVHHNEDETFYALEGEILALVGDERITLSAGDFAFAPRGVPHATVVSSERARVLVTTSPGGPRGELFVSLGSTVTASEPDYVACQATITGTFVRNYTRLPVGLPPPNGSRVVCELMNSFRDDDQGRLAQEWVQTENRSRLHQLDVKAAERVSHQVSKSRTMRRQAPYKPA